MPLSPRVLSFVRTRGEREQSPAIFLLLPRPFQGRAMVSTSTVRRRPSSVVPGRGFRF